MGRIAQIQQKQNEREAEQREREETAAQEERDLIFLRLRVGSELGMEFRHSPYPVRYMTREELQECLGYAKAKNLAAIREMFEEIRERVYPMLAAEAMQKAA